MIRPVRVVGAAQQDMQAGMLVEIEIDMVTGRALVRPVHGGETADGMANTCTHQSATGVDTTPMGPEKVWRCDHCGLTWQQEGRVFTEQRVKDMIWLAENRGGEKMLVALRASKTDHDRIVLERRDVSATLLQRDFEKELGR